MVNNCVISNNVFGSHMNRAVWGEGAKEHFNLYIIFIVNIHTIYAKSLRLRRTVGEEGTAPTSQNIYRLFFKNIADFLFWFIFNLFEFLRFVYYLISFFGST